MGDMDPKTDETGYEALFVEPGTLSNICSGKPVVLMGKRYAVQTTAHRSNGKCSACGFNLYAWNDYCASCGSKIIQPEK